MQEHASRQQESMGELRASHEEAVSSLEKRSAGVAELQAKLNVLRSAFCLSFASLSPLFRLSFASLAPLSSLELERISWRLRFCGRPPTRSD